MTCGWPQQCGGCCAARKFALSSSPTRSPAVVRSCKTAAPQANEALRAEIERLRNEPSPLVAARAKKEETLGDKEKFVKLLDNLQVCRAGERCCAGSWELAEAQLGTWEAPACGQKHATMQGVQKLGRGGGMQVH